MTVSGCVVALFACAVSVTSTHLPAAGQQAAQSQSAGLAVYDRVCHVCHGPEGRGDAAPRLVPFKRSYEELLAIVRDGVGQMPPISDRRVKDEEIAQVVEYLKSRASPKP